MNARGVKGKKRKRKAKRDDPAQSERFIAAARKLGADESGKDFDRVMTALLTGKNDKKRG